MKHALSLVLCLCLISCSSTKQMDNAPDILGIKLAKITYEEFEDNFTFDLLFNKETKGGYMHPLWFSDLTPKPQSVLVIFLQATKSVSATQFCYSFSAQNFQKLNEKFSKGAKLLGAYKHEIKGEDKISLKALSKTFEYNDAFVRLLTYTIYGTKVRSQKIMLSYAYQKGGENPFTDQNLKKTCDTILSKAKEAFLIEEKLQKKEK